MRRFKFLLYCILIGGITLSLFAQNPWPNRRGDPFNTGYAQGFAGPKELFPYDKIPTSPNADTPLVLANGIIAVKSANRTGTLNIYRHARDREPGIITPTNGFQFENAGCIIGNDFYFSVVTDYTFRILKLPGLSYDQPEYSEIVPLIENPNDFLGIYQLGTRDSLIVCTNSFVALFDASTLRLINSRQWSLPDQENDTARIRTALVTSDKIYLGLQYGVLSVDADSLYIDSQNAIKNCPFVRIYNDQNEDREWIKWLVKDPRGSSLWAGGEYPIYRLTFDESGSDRFTSGSLDEVAPIALLGDSYLVAAGAPQSDNNLYILDKISLQEVDRWQLENADWRFTTAPIVDKNKRIYITAKNTRNENSDRLLLFQTDGGTFNGDPQVTAIFGEVDPEGKERDRGFLSLALDDQKRIIVPTYSGLEVFSERELPDRFEKKADLPPDTVCAGTQIEQRLEVRLFNQFNEPMSNIEINFTTNQNGRLVLRGTESNSVNVITDGHGRASVEWKPGFWNDTQTVTAQIANSTYTNLPPPVTFSAKIKKSELGLNFEETIFRPNSEIDFGKINISDIGIISKQLLVENIGDECPLPVISSIVLKDSASHPIRFRCESTGSCWPDSIDLSNITNLKPGQTLPVSFKFIGTPLEKIYTSKLEIHFAGPVEKSLIYNLRVKFTNDVCEAKFTTQQSAVSFAAIQHGTSVTTKFTLQNDDYCAIDDFSISFEQTNQFTIINAGEIPEAVGPGDSLDLHIEFNPPASGLYTDYLIVNNEGETDLRIPVSGLSLPDTIVFESTTFVDTSTKIYNFENHSDDSVHISVLPPTNPSFRVINSDASTNILPNENSKLRLRFNPDRIKMFEDSLFVVFNGKKSQHKLSGEGTDVISLLPDSNQYREICLGDTATLQIKIENLSHKIFEADSIRVLGASFSAKEESLTIQADGREGFALKFHPLVPGNNSGEFQIWHNDGHKSALQLSGIGKSAHAELSPASLNFIVKCNARADTATLTIKNNGNCPLEVQNIFFEEKLDTEYRLIDPPDFPKTVVDSFALKVEFSPHQFRIATQQHLIIQTNEFAGTHVLAVNAVDNRDSLPPEPPENLRIIPQSWTNNPFRIEWQSQEPILKQLFISCSLEDSCARIVVDSSDIHKKDGWWFIDDFEPQPGWQHLYVWLADSCGNSNLAKFSKINCLYDTTPVSINLNKPKAVQVDSSISVSLKLHDDESGIKTVYFSYWTSGSTDSINWQIFQYDTTFVIEKMTAEGYILKVETEDFAGNRSQLREFVAPKFADNHTKININAGQFRLISFPYRLDENKGFAPLQSTTGSAQNRRIIQFWKIDRDDGDQIFPFIPIEDSDSLSPGESLFTQSENNLDLKTTSGIGVAAHIPYQLSIHSGWNLIANPFPFSMHVRNVRPTDLVNQIYDFNNQFRKIKNNYLLQPFSGYLLWAFPGDSVITFNPYQYEIKDSTLKWPEFKANAEPYRIKISAIVSGNPEDEVVCILNDETATGWDAFDVMHPPVLERSPIIYFDHLDWVEHPGKYMRDVRPIPDYQSDEVTNETQFRFKVKNYADKNNLKLQFDISPKILQDYTLKLFHNSDNSTLTTIGAEQKLYNCTALEEQLARRSELPFILIITQKLKTRTLFESTASSAKTDLMVRCYPNPFSDFTRFVISVFKKDAVSLDIYDLHGRKIKRLIEMQDFATGNYFYDWTGRDDLGHRVASGVYFAKIRTKSGMVRLVKMIHLQ